MYPYGVGRYIPERECICTTDSKYPEGAAVVLRDYPGFRKIYIATGFTDLRKGIDGLAAIVQMQFHLSPFQKDVLFLFCGRKQNRFKALVWEGDGFLLLYKRIEAGRIQWPKTMKDVEELDQDDLKQLLDGYAILQKSTIRQVSYTRTL